MHCRIPSGFHSLVHTSLPTRSSFTFLPALPDSRPSSTARLISTGFLVDSSMMFQPFFGRFLGGFLGRFLADSWTDSWADSWRIRAVAAESGASIRDDRYGGWSQLVRVTLSQSTYLRWNHTENLPKESPKRILAAKRQSERESLHAASSDSPLPSKHISEYSRKSHKNLIPPTIAEFRHHLQESTILIRILGRIILGFFLLQIIRMDPGATPCSKLTEILGSVTFALHLMSQSTRSSNGNLSVDFAISLWP